MGGNMAFKVNKYFHTEWKPEHALNLKIESLNMDAVWGGISSFKSAGLKSGKENPWMSRYKLMTKRQNSKRKSRSWKSRLGMRSSQIRSFSLRSRLKR